VTNVTTVRRWGILGGIARRTAGGQNAEIDRGIKEGLALLIKKESM
jgi:hypothetical protein